jgi:hypothetical protein
MPPVATSSHFVEESNLKTQQHPYYYQAFSGCQIIGHYLIDTLRTTFPHLSVYTPEAS